MPVITLNGDEATCVAYVQARHHPNGTGGSDQVMYGYYTNRFVRAAGGWKIRARKLNVTWNEGNMDISAEVISPRRALVFVFCGEFAQFAGAFYHSAMNYTTLGYGDVVMTPSWKLFGPLEAADGMLMFGVSTAIIVSVIQLMVRTRFRDLPSF